MKKVEIFKGDAINKIKFTFDDRTTWSTGNDGGKSDSTPVILTTGEYIVKVRHEKLLNKLCAGAGVHFETNKGRLFSYTPSLSTKRAQDETVMTAEPGNEIISLRIIKGILIGIE